MHGRPRQWHGQGRALSEPVADEIADGAVVDVVVPVSNAAWALLAGALRDCTGATRVLLVRFATPEPPRGGCEALPDEPDEPDDGQLSARAPAGYAAAALASPSLVSVAVVDRPLTGAALGVALHCDLRVFSTAADVSVSVETIAGLSRLVDLVGRGRATELSLTGRRLSAAEAVDVGLAAVAVQPAELESAVADLVAAVLAGGRDAVTELKAALSSSGPGRGRGREQRATGELAALARLAGAGAET